MIVAMGDDKKKEKEYREKGIKLPTTIEANNWYIGFNWLDPVVGKGDTPAQAERNRKLRQALSIAIDWEEHIAIFERGQGVAAQGPLPPSLFGYREDGPSAFNPGGLPEGSRRQAGAPLDRRGEEAAGRGGLSRRPRREDRQAAGAELRLPVRADPRRQGAARLVHEAVREDRRADGGARDRLQPLPGQDVARARSRSSSGAGSPTTRTRRTSCSCCTGRTRRR